MQFGSHPFCECDLQTFLPNISLVYFNAFSLLSFLKNKSRLYEFFMLSACL
jgi:hypothetical protein